MSELRKDYILDEWVIINEKRGLRPRQFKPSHITEDISGCFFCPGNEELTPKEIGRVEENGKWKLRWFDNKFPIVTFTGEPKLKKKGLFQSMHGYGYHEVIVDNPDHHKQLWDLTEKDFHELMRIYALRTDQLNREKHVEYVHVFKNHGPDGGTSIIHSHTQIMTLPLMPARVRDKVAASKKNGKCLYCEVIKKERKSKRFAFENKSFTAICPYASRFNYEIWIFSRKHKKSIVDFNDNELKDLANILRRILLKLRFMNVSYNYLVFNAPKGKDLHFHIEVTPRVAKWAGLELASDVIVNSVAPEGAALFYKGK